MNILSREKQIEIVAALVEGCSIRATERLTGVHRDTIMRLGVRVGQGCARVHDELMQNLQPAAVELDEIWSFVGKKQRKATPEGSDEFGDQYTFLALDRTGKAIISYRVGKRTIWTTSQFLKDLRRRTINVPQISSDAMPHYREQVESIFGETCTYGQIVKRYAGDQSTKANRRYSPGYVVAVDRKQVIGGMRDRDISTSLVERSNLTLRMQQRRFTRLTSGFSKKLENHQAAVSLFVAHYNLCRVHETIRQTPAMASAVTDHVWSIGELVDAALGGELPQIPGKQVGRFRVIDGGVS